MATPNALDLANAAAMGMSPSYVGGSNTTTPQPVNAQTSGIVGGNNPTGAIMPAGSSSSQNPSGSSAVPVMDANGQYYYPGSGQGNYPTSSTSSTSTTPGMIPPPTAPDSEATIQAQMLAEQQANIDAINAQFSATIAQDTTAAANNQTNVNASAARMGLMGSPGGASMLSTQASKDNQVIASDRAGQQAALAAVYNTVDTNALAQANLEKQQAITDSQAYLAQQQSIAAVALSNASAFAAAGKTGQDIATNDPTTWSQLQQQTGLSSYALTQYMFSKLPPAYQPQATTSYSADANGNTVENIVYSTVDPSTGKSSVTQQSFNLGIPYASFNPKGMLTAADGTPLYIKTNNDGTTTTINAETGQPYVPVTAVPNTSTLTNTQTGAIVGGTTTPDTSWVPSGYTTGTSTSELANNNPGGIQIAGLAAAQAIDPGAVAGTNGQVQFSSPALGQQAMTSMLNSSQYSGLTVAQALQTWTGKTGYGANATTISNLLKQFNIDPAAKVSDIMSSNPDNLTNAIMTGEGSIAPTTPGTGSDNTLWNEVTAGNPSLANQLQKAGVTASSLNTQAQMWILNGGSVSSSGSSMGGGGIAIKQAINSAGSSLANQLFGANSASIVKEIAARETGLSGSIDSLISYQGNVQQLEGTAQSLLQDVTAAAGQVDLTNAAAVNEWAQAIQNGLYGSGALTSLQNYISAFSGEYGKVISGSMGSAAATDQAMTNAQQRLTSAMNSGQMGAALVAMNTEMQQRMQNINNTISDQQNSMMTILQQTADTSGGGTGGMGNSGSSSNGTYQGFTLPN